MSCLVNLPYRCHYFRDLCEWGGQILDVLLAKLEHLHDVHGIGGSPLAHFCISTKGGLSGLYFQGSKNDTHFKDDTNRDDANAARRIHALASAEFDQWRRNHIIHAAAAGFGEGHAPQSRQAALQFGVGWRRNPRDRSYTWVDKRDFACPICWLEGRRARSTTAAIIIMKSGDHFSLSTFVHEDRFQWFSFLFKLIGAFVFSKGIGFGKVLQVSHMKKSSKAMEEAVELVRIEVLNQFLGNAIRFESTIIDIEINFI